MRKFFASALFACSITSTFLFLGRRIIIKAKEEDEKFFNIPSQLRNKAYLRSNPFVQRLNQIRVLILKEEKDQKKLNFQKHEIGETSFFILHLQEDFLNEEQKEELEIRLSGLRNWASPMRSSGWFSSFALGRKFGRDSEEEENFPHVFILERVNLNQSDIAWLEETCRDHNIKFKIKQSSFESDLLFLLKNLKQELKTKYILQHLQTKYKEGFADAKKKVEIAHNEGLKVKNELLLRDNNFQNEELKKKYQEGYKLGYKTGYETGHQIGYTEGMRIQAQADSNTR